MAGINSEKFHIKILLLCVVYRIVFCGKFKFKSTYLSIAGNISPGFVRVLLHLIQRYSYLFNYVSRHTVVCRAAQEADVPPVSILTGRKKTKFSHLCSSVIPYPIGTKLAREVPASKGSLHTKFEENRSSHFRDTSEQHFVSISSFFSSSTSSFRTLRKIRHKTRMRARIGLKFGTLKGLIKADLCTNLGRNPMNIHGVMTDYLRKIRSKVCHAYR